MFIQGEVGPEVDAEIVHVSRGQELSRRRHADTGDRGVHAKTVHKPPSGQVPGANRGVHGTTQQPARIWAERLQ